MAGDGSPIHQRNIKLTLPPGAAHEGHALPPAAAAAAPGGIIRRLSVKTPLQGESAKLIPAISREDIHVRRESHYAAGTPQARKLVTIGSVKYRTSKGTREAKTENTYRMEPMVKFRWSRAEEVINNVFRDLITPHTAYPSRAQDARHLVKMATNEIRNKTRMFNYDRYRIVVLVTLGEHAGQAMRMASRCLWSPAVDTFASVTYETRNLFIVGIVFAVYFE